MDLDSKKIAVIGLGYVGLPLAVEFGKKRNVIGFDINKNRIAELKCGLDNTLEVSTDELKQVKHLSYSSEIDDLKQCEIFIITVPTPIDGANRPDLTPLISATKAIGKIITPSSIIIYESTVYPGCTREVCVPILEEESGLVFNKDFFVGYSPERINPGDHEHRLPTIVKVTSGSTPDAADAIDKIYAEIITAGTHKTSSIEIAEAAKVIENTQRDLNIALMNELAIIFNKLNIDTLEVLEASGTKWNFLPFKPGLVGGHCIGVDPYYLTHKAQEVGYHPEVILAGRRINDGMARFVADQTAHLMMKNGLPVVGSRILILGLTFKENCPDLRNSKVFDIITHLKDYNAIVDIYDPWVNIDDAKHEYGITCMKNPPNEKVYDGIILAVGHREFMEMGISKIHEFGKSEAIIYDVKGLFEKQNSHGRL